MLILCDIDGTLFDNTHRAHLLPVNASTTEDWEAFNAAHVDDQPIGYRIGLLNVLAEEHRVIYITGRTETQRTTTIQQLALHGCPDGSLIMREEGNDLWAPELKAAMVRRVLMHYQVVAPGTDVVIIEDDHRTCERLGREFPAAKIVRVPSACCAYLAREIWQARHAVADPQAISSVLSCSADVMERLAEENKQQQVRIAELEAQAAIGRRAVEMLQKHSKVFGETGASLWCVECEEADTCSDHCKLAAILRDASDQGILDGSAPKPDTVAVGAGVALAAMIREDEGIADDADLCERIERLCSLDDARRLLASGGE